MRVKSVISFITILTFVPLLSFAGTINVPGDHPTIQDAVDAAADGDVILLADGSYSGEGNRDVDLKGKSITIRSAHGAEKCIIDCEQEGRAFLIQDGETVTLDGLTIKNGFANGPNSETGWGGAVYVSNANAAISNCVFIDNSASGCGGAVSSCDPSTFDTSFTFDNCEFTGNECTSSGGAIYAYFAYSCTGCNFRENQATDGGAVYLSTGSLARVPVFTDCTFRGNSSTYKGGAAFFYTSTPSFNDCWFAENFSSYYGGAVYLSDAAGNFIRCRFNDNNANKKGGAIYLYSTDNPDFTNCLFIENRAPLGGAVYNHYSRGNFLNCTFSMNQASEQGGSLWCDIAKEEMVALKNCILWADTAPESPEIYTENRSPTVVYSDIYGGYEGEGNISEDPLFLAFDPEKFYLRPYSPCVDTASSDGAPGDDIDGSIRPVGKGIDMGAYEYQNDVYVWEGRSPEWNEADNWNLSQVPGSSDMVIVSSRLAAEDPDIDSGAIRVGRLLIESGKLKISGGELTIL